jgi:hypothetical protein
MRFFRAIQAPRSAEDEAAAVRLMAVAHRGKTGSTPAWETAEMPDRQAEPPEEPVLQ